MQGRSTGRLVQAVAVAIVDTESEVAMPDVRCDRKRCVYCDRECCKAARLYYVDRRCMTFLERIVVPVPMIERLDTYQERGSKARSWK